MQISTTQLYDRSTSAMQTLSARADSLNQQISTGKRFDTASQDVLGFGRLQTLRRGAADDTVNAANVALAQSLLEQTEATLATVESRLQRASELAIQARSDTLSESGRNVIAVELREIVQDLVTLAGSTDLRGQPLFGAADGGPAIIVAPGGNITFPADAAPSAIPIGDGQTVQASETAARVFGGLQTGFGANDNAFAILSRLADGLASGGPAAGVIAAQGIDSIRIAIDQIGQVRGSVGARSARLELESERLRSVAVDREEARIKIEDTDIATSIAELQKTMTVLQATQASFAKLSALSLFNFLR